MTELYFISIKDSNLLFFEMFENFDLSSIGFEITTQLFLIFFLNSNFLSLIVSHLRITSVIEFTINSIFSNF